MGWGDELVAAGQAQRLWDADPSTRIAIYGLDGRPRWHEAWEGNPIIATPDHVAAGERVRRITNCPGFRPYLINPMTKESGWVFNRAWRCRDHIPRLYLTDAEREMATAARVVHGPFVLIEPFTKHANFRWSLRHWQAVVDACPDLTFVQHTHPDSPRLRRVSYVPATFRQAAALASLASVYVRSESGLCHAAAALGVRQVTLFGGCMDPEVMGYYPGQTVIADTGEGSPCGRWLPCDHCRDCMDRITVDRVAEALRATLAARKAA